MITVKLPRASWDEVMACLDYLDNHEGWYVSSLRKDIENQVDKQEG